MVHFEISNRKNKKYKVFYNNRWIHFGDTRYQHYKDNTGLHKYSKLDHLDKIRRTNYRQRASKIRDASGKLTYNNKNSANYWAYHYLW